MRVRHKPIRFDERSFVAGYFRAGDPSDDRQRRGDDPEGCEEPDGEENVIGEFWRLQRFAKLGLEEQRGCEVSDAGGQERDDEKWNAGFATRASWVTSTTVVPWSRA